ncbi:MAG TPA: hypothetical protein PKY55_11060 [bacterium]|nr:hypothetical protein [bacterium]
MSLVSTAALNPVAPESPESWANPEARNLVPTRKELPGRVFG